MYSIQYKFTTSDEEYSCNMPDRNEGEIMSEQEICNAVLNNIFGNDHPCTLQIIKKTFTEMGYVVLFKRIYKERFAAIPSFPQEPITPKPKPPRTRPPRVFTKRWRSRSPVRRKRWHSPNEKWRPRRKQFKKYSKKKRIKRY